MPSSPQALPMFSFVDDTNYVPPDIPSRTDALLSNISITEHDVKDIL
jgi:hypothetical protein